MLTHAPDPAAEAVFADLERRAVRFFLDHTHPTTGLTKDRAKNSPGPDDHTVASSASTGFALVAFAIAAERKWEPRAEMRRRTLVSLRGVNDVLQHYRGWSFHFSHWATGEREWKSEASTIDSSILLAGIVAAREYWRDPEITREANRYRDRLDWEAVRTDGGATPDQPLISMGYIPEKGYIDGRWGKSTFDECKMIYVQAYGLNPKTPPGAWAAMARKHETYRGLDFLTGGPLFLHQMSESFYDFRGLRDRLGYDYGIAARNASAANRLYCLDNPKGFAAYGPGFWGLSACDVPNGYTALGAPGWTEDNGTITPTSAVATVNLLPKEAAEFVVRFRREHPQAWGPYGFPNGVNASEKWQSPDVIGIDLGMMMCALANRRSYVWKLSSKAPEIRRGYETIGLRKAGGTELKTPPSNTKK